MGEAYIVAAARTAVGRKGGKVSGWHPADLGGVVLDALVERSGADLLANVVFTPLADRDGRTVLIVRDQNTFRPALRRKRLMTLLHLFLIHRYAAVAVHYLSPTADNRQQTARLRDLALFGSVDAGSAAVLVAGVNPARVAELVAADRAALGRLIGRA